MLLSVTDNVALKLPESGGVNITSITQFALGFKVAGQSLVSVKVPLLGAIPMAVMLTADVPSLYSVTLMGELLVPGV